MIPTFVIYLREGIEASMIVAILLAYLDRVGQRRHFRDVFLGVGAAVALMVGGGIAAYLWIHSYSGSRAQTIFETVTYLVATVALTYMTFWMNHHGRTLGKEIEARGDAVISRGSRTGMALLAFSSVGREGLETMVFTLAIIFASSAQAPTANHSRLLVIGGLLGLLVAMAIATLIYKLGRRVNLRLFFRVLGITLLVFAAGLLSDAIENLQSLGWLPFGRHQMWNTGHMLRESSTVGDLFHSLVGYAEAPTVLQGVTWVAYVAIVVAMFSFLSRRRSAPPKVTS